MMKHFLERFIGKRLHSVNQINDAYYTLFHCNPDSVQETDIKMFVTVLQEEKHHQKLTSKEFTDMNHEAYDKNSNYMHRFYQKCISICSQQYCKDLLNTDPFVHEKFKKILVAVNNKVSQHIKTNK